MPYDIPTIKTNTIQILKDVADGHTSLDWHHASDAYNALHGTAQAHVVDLPAKTVNTQETANIVDVLHTVANGGHNLARDHAKVSYGKLTSTPPTLDIVAV